MLVIKFRLFNARGSYEWLRLVLVVVKSPSLSWPSPADLSEAELDSDLFSSVCKSQPADTQPNRKYPRALHPPRAAAT